MSPVVDLNCDIGESFGAYSIGNDPEIISSITSANIACGFHASDPDVMEKTVRLCKENSVMVGAHPGYPDLAGFGRRFMDMGENEMINSIIYQVGALKGFADYHRVPLQHMKLHGALYNFMITREGLFLSVIDSVRQAFGNMIFLTLGTARTNELKKRAAQAGIRLALEAFPDRAYTDNGDLMPRRYKGAVLKDPEVIAQRALTMINNGGVESENGTWIAMDIDTLCIHGDNGESIRAARQIREAAASQGIDIRPLSSFLP